MTLDEVSGELYGLDPAEFVAMRSERAAAARADGDRELAAAITALRKPTRTAWAVNLLAREAPDEIEALLGLGDALRAAQRKLSGAELRTLGGQRQQVVNAMSARAGELAAERGHRLGEQTLREVGQTLTAALADPEIAERVRAGTLATGATYEGFGPAGLVAVSSGARPSPRRRRSRAPERDDDAEARRELADAEAALADAETALRSAEEEAEAAATASARCDDEIARLRAELEHAEQQRQFARTTEHRARGEATAARTQYERMRRWADRARQRLADQRGASDPG
ncbi:hypothetical protein ACFYTF_06165 [Nocardia thailandica]|uniref:Transposase n=1 Tax=Nocardia thailandica TaxID=257275 RepID=A0ABW6PJ68_9NOCA